MRGRAVLHHNDYLELKASLTLSSNDRNQRLNVGSLFIPTKFTETAWI